MRSAAFRFAVLAVLAATPSHAASLYGLVDTGELFRSTDGGVTWATLAALPVRDAAALAAHVTPDELFLASRSGGVYRSEDAGASWTPVGAIAAPDVAALRIRADGTLLVLCEGGALHASDDLGGTFTPLAALTGPGFVSLASTAPDGRLYALTRTGEAWESEDGGASWLAKGTFPAPDAVQLTSLGAVLFALTGTGDVHRSDDRAATWSPVGALSQTGMRALVRNGPALAAATREGHVAASADGAVWSWQGSINQLTLTALATDEPAVTGVVAGQPPPAIELGAPFPNPTRGPLSFALRLDRAGEVRLALYDAGGRRVASRPAGRRSAGHHTLLWEPGPLAPGVHLLEVSSGGRTAARRCLVLR